MGRDLNDAWRNLSDDEVNAEYAAKWETRLTALPQPEQAAAVEDGLGEWDAGDDDSPPAPRGWLLGNTFCRKFVSSIISAGGTGKTAARTAQAMALATGRPLTGEHVFRRCRVLLVSFEDDRDELRRRVLAAMLHHGVSAADLKGWLFLASVTGKNWKLATAENGVVRRGELITRIEKTIVLHKIDVVILDPFVKTHAVPENDNGAIDQVVAILVQIAIDYDCAVDAPHHTSKAPSEPGNANSARGASSFRDGGRLAYTLLPMSSDEAQTFGVQEEERRRLVRIDSAKVNTVLSSTSARWLRLVSVAIGNATDDYPQGDNVQTVEPWTPPDMWRDLPPSLCCRIIDEIDLGTPDGERFSGSPAAKARGAWNVVRRHAPKLNERQAKRVIATWLRTEVLEQQKYNSEARREECTGLFANPLKRPGVCPNE